MPPHKAWEKLSLSSDSQRPVQGGQLPTICGAGALRLQVSGIGREAATAGRQAGESGSSPQSTSPRCEERRVNIATS